MFNKLKNKKKLIFIILILLFLFTRVIILFTSPYLHDWEECYIGTIAKEVIQGPKFPFLDYTYQRHYLGSLFSGIIIVPFFLVFGESGISLKLAALSIAFLTLITIYLFLKKFFDTKTAVFFAFLFIFPMPYYTISQLISQGSHTYPLLFDAIIMFLFYNIFFDNKKDFKNFMLFGFMCGFAVWFIFQSLVMVFTCFLFWFIFDKKFFLRKYFLIFLLFFLIGYSPGIYYNLTHNFKGIINPKMEQGLIISPTNPGFYSEKLCRFLNIVFYQIPISFKFPNFNFWKYIIPYTYYCIFVFSFLVILWSCRKSIIKLIMDLFRKIGHNINPKNVKKECFILSYITIFITIYSLSNFKFNYYYLLALYPFILIIFSLFISKLYNSRSRFFYLIIFFLLIVMGLVGNINLISFDGVSKGGKIYEPYCYYYLSAEFGCHATNFKSAVNICNKFDLEDQKYCYLSYIEHPFCDGCDNMLCYTSECNKFDLEHRNYCYEGIGRCLYYKNKENLDKAFEMCNVFDNEQRDFCYKGLSENIGLNLDKEMEESIAICNKIDSKYRNYCYDGLALYMHESSRKSASYYPPKEIEECISLERRLIISRNKTICLLKLVNSSLNISSNKSLD